MGSGTGRSYFEKHKKIINFLFGVYALIPNFFTPILTFFSFGKISVLFRYFHFRKYCLSIGDNVYFSKNVVAKNINNLAIGSNFSIHEFSYIDAAGGIEIGDNVSVAHNCSLISFEHTWADVNTPIKYNPTSMGKITIGNDVWLGCGVRVLSGATIEDRVIVAAGAVVKGRLQSGYIYGGVPAKKLRQL